jgi:competence protein ComEC
MSYPTDEEQPRGFLTAPLLVLSASFALGIVAANAPRGSLAETLRSVPVLVALGGACLLAGLILTRARRPALAGLLALAGFAVSGAAAARLFEFRFPARHISHLEDLGLDLRDAVRVSGRLVSSPLEIPSGLQFDLEVSSIEDGGHAYPLSGKIRVDLRRGRDAQALERQESLRLAYGDSIRALVVLERPLVYRDPGVFDFRRWMASIHDVYWEGTIKSPLLVEKLPRHGAPSFGELLARVRQRLLRGIDRLYPPWTIEGRDGAVLKAVLLGDRSSLDSKTLDDFRQAGLYHLLVISGLHVGLLAMLAALLLRLTPLGEAWRSALVLLILLGYCSLVEQRAPTLRATIMIAAYLVGRFFYRRGAALNAVGLAALALLLARPPWLFQSGFQLSFAAALLIVALIVPILQRTTEPYRRALRNVSRVDRDAVFPPRLAQLRIDVRRLAAGIANRTSFGRDHAGAITRAAALPLRVLVWTVSTLIFTTILQIGLMLPLAATFHRVTFAGIGLNAVAIPVMTVLLAVALPTVLLAALWYAAAVWPAKLLGWIMQLLFAITSWPHLPAWLSYRVPTPPVWASWGFVISIVVAAWCFTRSRRVFWFSVAGVAVFAVFISLDPFSPRLPAGGVEITALDCGAGDAFFVVLPDRTTLLVDAGGSGARSESEDPFESRRWSAGEDIVSPYLWSRQIKKLDVVVMGGEGEGQLASLAAIARNFKLGEFWHAAAGRSPAALIFLDELARRGIRLRAIGTGQQISRGSVSIQVLWPPKPPAGGEPSPSSAGRGMMIRIADRDSSVLVADALDGQAQRAFLKNPDRLGAAVLAFAAPSSHESLTQPFAEGISPRIVLVSGRTQGVRGSSLLGAPGVLELAGARVLRSSHQGAVTADLQSGRISVHTYGMPAGEGTMGLASAASFTSSSRSVR